MVDTNQCKMFFEGGEEEYEEYYDYGEEEGEGEGEDANMAQGERAVMIPLIDSSASSIPLLALTGFHYRPDRNMQGACGL